MKSQKFIWLKLYLEVSLPIDLPMVLLAVLVKKKEVDPALVHSLVVDLKNVKVVTTRAVLKAYWQVVH